MSWTATSLIKAGASLTSETFTAALLDLDGTTNTDPLVGVTYVNLGGGDYGWSVALDDAVTAGFIRFTASPSGNEYHSAVENETVAVDTSGIASATAAALATQANLTVYAPATGGTLDLFRGDSYATANGRGITIIKAASETHWPNTLSTVHFTCKPTARTLNDHPSAVGLTNIACTVDVPTGSGRAFTLQLTSTQMATLTADGVGGYQAWFVANKDTAPAVLRSPSYTVRADPTA